MPTRHSPAPHPSMQCPSPAPLGVSLHVKSAWASLPHCSPVLHHDTLEDAQVLHAEQQNRNESLCWAAKESVQGQFIYNAQQNIPNMLFIFLSSSQAWKLLCNYCPRSLNSKILLQLALPASCCLFSLYLQDMSYCLPPVILGLFQCK